MNRPTVSRKGSCAVDNCDINGQIHDVLALKPYNLINMELLLTIPICLSS